MPEHVRLREILIWRATVHNVAIVQDLDLPALDPEIVAMRRVGQEILHQLDALGPLRVEPAAALEVATLDDFGIEADAQAAALGGEDRIPVVGIGCLVVLLVAIEWLVEPRQQLRLTVAEEVVRGI